MNSQDQFPLGLTGLISLQSKGHLCLYLTSYQSEWPSAKNKKNLETINAGEDVEKREPFHNVGGNVNWYNHYGE